jgi:TPR repeat protein
MAKSRIPSPDVLRLISVLLLAAVTAFALNDASHRIHANSCPPRTFLAGAAGEGYAALWWLPLILVSLALALPVVALVMRRSGGRLTVKASCLWSFGLALLAVPPLVNGGAGSYCAGQEALAYRSSHFAPPRLYGWGDVARIFARCGGNARERDVGFELIMSDSTEIELANAANDFMASFPALGDALAGRAFVYDISGVDPDCDAEGDLMRRPGGTMVFSSPMQPGVAAGIAADRHGNSAAALKIYRSEAAAGDPIAETCLGLFYDLGRLDVGIDRKEAARLYRLAAAQNEAAGYYLLGTLAETGEGVPLDFSEAARLYTLAADRGNVRAMNNLADLYDSGRGVAADRAKAAALWHESARQGDPKAMFNYAVALAYGPDAESDKNAAVDWWHRARIAGVRHAMNFIEPGGRHSPFTLPDK